MKVKWQWAAVGVLAMLVLMTIPAMADGTGQAMTPVPVDASAFEGAPFWLDPAAAGAAAAKAEEWNSLTRCEKNWRRARDMLRSPPEWIESGPWNGERFERINASYREIVRKQYDEMSSLGGGTCPAYPPVPTEGFTCTQVGGPDDCLFPGMIGSHPQGQCECETCEVQCTSPCGECKPWFYIEFVPTTLDLHWKCTCATDQGGTSDFCNCHNKSGELKTQTAHGTWVMVCYSGGQTRWATGVPNTVQSYSQVCSQCDPYIFNQNYQCVPPCSPDCYWCCSSTATSDLRYTAKPATFCNTCFTTGVPCT